MHNFRIRKGKPCFSQICQKVEDWLRLFSRLYSFIRSIICPAIRYIKRGKTMTDKGIKKMANVFQTQGRLRENNMQSIGFILTDGQSHERPDRAAKEARYAKSLWKGIISRKVFSSDYLSSLWPWQCQWIFDVVYELISFFPTLIHELKMKCCNYSCMNLQSWL